MFKKILMLGASVLLATVSATAMAGSAPTYSIAQISGAVKVVRNETSENGASKLFKDGASTKGLIYLAMGIDPDNVNPEAQAAAKNWVLALAYNTFEAAEIVVWDKVGQEVVGELALVQISGPPTYSKPADNTAGSVKGFSPVIVTFVQGSCASSEYGQAAGLLMLNGKIDNDEHVTPGAFNIIGLAGYFPGDGEGQSTVITDGAFKGNLAKVLATDVSDSIALNGGCD